MKVRGADDGDGSGGDSEAAPDVPVVVLEKLKRAVVNFVKPPPVTAALTVRSCACTHTPSSVQTSVVVDTQAHPKPFFPSNSIR